MAAAPLLGRQKKDRQAGAVEPGLCSGCPACCLKAATMDTNAPHLLLVLTATRRACAACLLQEQLAESLGQHRAREYNVEEDGK